MILWGILVLWIHLFAAIIFIGGSFFIWVVVWPVSYRLTNDERERTRIVGEIGKRFAFFTNISLIVLLLSGIYLAIQYLPSTGALLSTLGGEILLAKSILVIVMIVLMYTNNIYHGKKIMTLVSQGKLDDTRRVRRITHMASFVTLGLLVTITVLAVALQQI